MENLYKVRIKSVFLQILLMSFIELDRLVDPGIMHTSVLIFCP